MSVSAIPVNALAARRICILAHARLEREALALLIQNRAGYQAAADSGFDAVTIWNALRCVPDMAIVHSDRPPFEIRDLIEMLPRVRPRLLVLVISSLADPGTLKTWRDMPIHGYLSAAANQEEFWAAVEAIFAGNHYFSADVRGLMDNSRLAESRFPRLSRREAELLPLLARGMSLREAAGAMTISYKTADTYRTSLLRKLGVRDRVALARLAIRERIIDP